MSFMIKAMQQQFEHMNTRFYDMRDRMEEQANTKLMRFLKQEGN